MKKRLRKIIHILVICGHIGAAIHGADIVFQAGHAVTGTATSA